MPSYLKTCQNFSFCIFLGTVLFSSLNLRWSHVAGSGFEALKGFPWAKTLPTSLQVCVAPAARQCCALQSRGRVILVIPSIASARCSFHLEGPKLSNSLAKVSQQTMQLLSSQMALGKLMWLGVLQDTNAPEAHALTQNLQSTFAKIHFYFWLSQ